MFDLTGKVALVAGGSGYLGLPVCRGLAQQGAAVAIAGRDAAKLEQAVGHVREIARDRTIGVQLDMGKQDSIREVVRKTVEHFGRLDVLVNATYWRGTEKTVDELTEADFDQSNHTHITGSFLLARQAAAVMNPGSSIIIYVSMYGLVSPDPHIYDPPLKPNPIEYGVAKAGLCQMTRYLAAVYGPRGIRVNALAPGPMPRPEFAPSEAPFLQRLADKTMLRRVGRRDETAGAAVFLASDESSYVTGSVLRVDGGWTAW